MSESEEDSIVSNEWPINDEWLQTVLTCYHKNNTPAGESAPTVKVETVNIRPGCQISESVLSDILAVDVTYKLNDDAEENVNLIIKLLPQDPFSRFFVTEAQFDLRENKFYTQIVSDLENLQNEKLGDSTDRVELPIPKCYHAHYTAATNTPDDSPIPPESVLVLQNIKPLGYVSGDFSRGLSQSQTVAALQAIARVHALSLALKLSDTGKSLLERYPFLFQTDRATDSYQQLVERGLPQLARFLQQKSGMDDILTALNEIRTKTKEIIEKLLSGKEPLALITHTDFWCNNLMFLETDAVAKCAILDWQMVTYSRPTNDLALLIISSVQSDLRRNQLKTFLDSYWSEFIACTQKLSVDVVETLGYTREQLDRDYRQSQLLALLLCVGSVDVALGDQMTEQRLLDVLSDLFADGVLSLQILNDDE